MKSRFIGPGPFLYEDREIFFGRNTEIDYLTTLILNNKTTVIHGRSGLGKSSLINAGIVPNLLKKYHCEIIRIRFFNNEKGRQRPVDTFVNALKARVKNKNKYLIDILDSEKHRAWQALKTLQWNNYSNENLNDLVSSSESAASKGIPVFKPFLLPEKNYLLVFDQFEEIFTYDVTQVKKFMKELQEVLCNIIPEEISGYLRKNVDDNEKVMKLRHELEILEKEIPVRLIFSIRSDQFNYMTHLVPFIPDLLKNTYKILRLGTSQLEAAISEPPLQPGNFITPSFQFDPPLVNELIEFLSGGADPEIPGKIEAFEMQIICKELEDILSRLLDKKGRTFFGDKIIFKRSHMFVDKDVTDKEQPFAEILKNYYKETIKKITAPAEALSARYLVERKLIDFRTNKRISLDSALVAEMGIEKETEKLLTEKSILRIESNSVSGSSYEISHDTLVPAIISASAELGDLDKKLHDYFQASLNLKKRASRKLFLQFVYNDIIVGKTDPLPANITSDDLITRQLSKSGVFIKFLPQVPGDSPVYAIREAFRPTAQKGKEQYQSFYHNKLSYKFFLAVFIGCLIILGLLLAGNTLIRKANRNFALYYLAYNIDTLQNKDTALRLAEYILKHNAVYSEDASLFNKKTLPLFQDQQIQSKEAIHTDILSVTTLKPEKTAISYDGKFKIVLISKTDSSNVPNNFNCKLSKLDGTIIHEFKDINNAYFLNRPGILLCSSSSVVPHEGRLYSRPFEMSDNLIFYDCNRDTDIFNYHFKKNELLYPYQLESSPVMENTENSYRVKMYGTENYAVPFTKVDDSGRSTSMIRIFRGGKFLKDLPFYFFSHTISDGKSLLVSGITNGQFSIKVYNETGDSTRILKNATFANYTRKNSILYDNGASLIYEKAGAKPQRTETDGIIEFAWIDSAENFLLIKTPYYIQTVNIKNGKSQRINEQLIGFDLNKKIILTIAGKSDLKAHYLENDKTVDSSYPDGIHAIKYNFKTGQSLLLTGKNRLLLLSPELNVLAGYQLTLNDIFGFSPAGNAFYYVRDQYYSVFLTNKGSLVNYFNSKLAFTWLDSTNKIPNIENKIIRKQYKLSFTTQIF